MLKYIFGVALSFNLLAIVYQSILIDVTTVYFND